MNINDYKNNSLLQDVGIVILSIFVAVILIRTNALMGILVFTQELKSLGSFVAGIFLVSIFTAAPAIATLSKIVQINSIVLTAIFGAMGAVVGDLIIFRFVRDSLSERLMELIKHQGAGKRIKALFRLKFFRWLIFLAGCLIIISPLPDEVGVGLLGFSKMKTWRFVPLSFIFNFIGILLIGLVAKTL